MSLTAHRTGAESRYPAGWLVGQLPVGMRDDDRLQRFTTIFERLGATLREGADGVEHAADPTVTSSAMLVYLGRWLGYDVIDPSLPIDRQRRIVAALGQGLPWRGTARGLRQVLETITDGAVRIRDCGGVLDEQTQAPAPGVIVVDVDDCGHLREHEFVAFVRDQVPAHLGIEVYVQGSRIDQTGEAER